MSISTATPNASTATPKSPSTPNKSVGVPKEEMCRYVSKRCYERRAVKKDGDLHAFCEFHREKANRNQQRLKAKRRRLKVQKKAEERARAAAIFAQDIAMPTFVFSPLNISSSPTTPMEFTGVMNCEPHQCPTQLLQEDIELLHHFLDSEPVVFSTEAFLQLELSFKTILAGGVEDKMVIV